MPPMPKEAGPRKEAWKALKSRFLDEQIPDDFTGEQLKKIVNQHLRNLPSDAIEGRFGKKLAWKLFFVQPDEKNNHLIDRRCGRSAH
jgi:hypothetical protein